jgi:hypothetical protein
LQLVLERLVKINHHDDTRLYGDPEQRNIANCDGNAEVVMEEPLQQ